MKPLTPNSRREEKKYSKRVIYKIFKDWFYNFISEEGSEPSEQYEYEALTNFKKEIKHYEKTQKRKSL